MHILCRYKGLTCLRHNIGVQHLPCQSERRQSLAAVAGVQLTSSHLPMHINGSRSSSRYMTKTLVPAIFLLILWMGRLSHSDTPFSWLSYDQFDEVNDHISSINGDNCFSKSKADLILRPDMVSQLPVYNRLLSQIWYRNRTSLIHLHNTALNRAFFYSYILQKMNESSSFYIQPNWLYMYMSATADVNANPYGINGSAVFFDTNCHYPNW